MKDALLAGESSQQAQRIDSFVRNNGRLLCLTMHTGKRKQSDQSVEGHPSGCNIHIVEYLSNGSWNRQYNCVGFLGV